MFHTLCPHCRSHLTAVETLIGHTMLCPLCHRPFVATPVAVTSQPKSLEEEMPVTARARRRQMSPGQIMLTIACVVIVIAMSIPLFICMGFGSRVQHHRTEIARQKDDLAKAARTALVEQGYTNVRVQATPARHDLGYEARASGNDKWGGKHQLTLVFRYDGQLVEVLMLKEGDRYKILSQIYEQWSGE